jgi:hypothetical protein
MIVNGHAVPKNGLQVVPTSDGRSFAGREEWAVRGAGNAGTAVLLYLSQVRDGVLAAKPSYDHCEQLKTTVVKMPKPGVCAAILKK